MLPFHLVSNWSSTGTRLNLFLCISLFTTTHWLISKYNLQQTTSYLSHADCLVFYEWHVEANFGIAERPTKLPRWLTRHLDLDDCWFGVPFWLHLGPTDDPECVRLALTLQNLHTLRIVDSPLSHGDFDKIARMSQLSELTLKDCQVDQADLDKLRPLVGLSGIGLEGIRLAGILTWLKQFPRLETVALTDCDLFRPERDQDFVSFPRVKHLFLDKVWLDPKYQEFLTSFPSVEQFWAEESNLGVHELSRLPDLARIVDFRIGNPEMGDEVFELLKRMPRLNTLSLASCAVTDRGAVSLAKLRGLKEIQLTDCPNISGDCLATIAKLPLLTKVMLLGTPVAFEKLAALKKATKLKSLSLSFDDYTAEQIKSLRTMLPGVSFPHLFEQIIP